MIKGVKNINKYLNKWLKQHGFDCTVMYGLDFGYDFINDIIIYSFVVPQKHDKLFLEICQGIEPRLKTCDNFILSFFHELGHYMTDDDTSDKQNEKYLALIEKLNNKEKLTLRDYKKYYLNDVELAATTWACQYIVKNQDDVKDFSDNIAKFLDKFIRLNNLEV